MSRGTQSPQFLSTTVDTKMNSDVNIDANTKYNELDKETTDAVFEVASENTTVMKRAASASTDSSSETDNAMSPSNVSNIESPEKVTRTDLEEGAWNCKHAACNAPDDQFMFKCSRCKECFHYKCTGLPPYQVALFLSPNHRGYRCENCVKVSV